MNNHIWLDMIWQLAEWLGPLNCNFKFIVVSNQTNKSFGSITAVKYLNREVAYQDKKKMNQIINILWSGSTIHHRNQQLLKLAIKKQF